MLFEIGSAQLHHDHRIHVLCERVVGHGLTSEDVLPTSGGSFQSPQPS